MNGVAILHGVICYVFNMGCPKKIPAVVPSAEVFRNGAFAK
jgi:hypothetical protein